ncbi:MAG: c-type cytochrome [Elusimicrobia bacterium]|nr:c-type cytochrome [Elusimicrobiota bacterium]
MTDWHAAYRERYKKLKEAGKPFFPYAVLKDTLVAALILCVLSYLAWHFGAGLEELADPTDTTYNPRPEWYFLFLFQALKFFPGTLEAVAATLLPGLGMLILILLPFIDRGPARHPLDRPFWTILGVATLAGIGWLTWAGYRSPLTNPVVEKDPVTLQGQRLYRDLNCSYCHILGGKGGQLGPNLDKVLGNHDDAWLTKHFRDPQALSPGTGMPKLDLLDDEIHALVAYLDSLGSGPYSAEAPKLFAENCAACHTIHGKGGDTGPDLSLIGSARDKAFMRNYIADPSKMNQASSMPGFSGQLTDHQIEDLARYLSSLR